MSSEPTAVREWLSTPLGRRCLTNEQRLMRRALERVFGEQMLQIGAWGARNSFLRYARTQRRALVDWRPGVAADLVCDPEQLAVASDSVDAVLLPHTLERTSSPHAVLREVDRILRPDGHLIVLSFAPGGLWGLRHLLSSGGYPKGRDHVIREGRLRDWLELLSFDVPAATRYCHTLPIERFKQLRDPAARGMGAALAAGLQRRLHAARAKTRASADAGAHVAPPAAPPRRRRARRADDARAGARGAASGPLSDPERS